MVRKVIRMAPENKIGLMSSSDIIGAARKKFAIGNIQ
jgi:hypothetical protein